MEMNSNYDDNELREEDILFDEINEETLQTYQCEFEEIIDEMANASPRSKTTSTSRTTEDRFLQKLDELGHRISSKLTRLVGSEEGNREEVLLLDSLLLPQGKRTGYNNYNDTKPSRYYPQVRCYYRESS